MCEAFDMFVYNCQSFGLIRAPNQISEYVVVTLNNVDKWLLILYDVVITIITSAIKLKTILKILCT